MVVVILFRESVAIDAGLLITSCVACGICGSKLFHVKIVLGKKLCLNSY